MLDKIIFCDRTNEFSDVIVEEFSNYSFKINRKLNIRKYTGDIKDLQGDNYCYFSPANSFLFFDGGVDKIYWKMFKELQKVAQKKLSEYPMKTTLGRNYLPIGSALMISVNNEKYNNNYVIACPTMFRPQDIRGTQNVYYAFLAGINLIDKYNKYVSDEKKIRTLVVPGLGTGYGKMTFEDSAKQIKKAFIDYYENKMNNDKMPNDYQIYMDEPNKNEQPNVYDNAELKTIDLSNLKIM